MAKKKACKKCKLFVEGPQCPICKGKEFSQLFQGKINIIDVNKSIIAQRMGKEQKGKYAIKVR